ncbi:MAG: zinc metalloprotease HtpX [Candidatus Thermoplasmatota archaeon]|nr:zinc metalloprotease HtpX [Candidatus Thermoplasmatota archaeon]
MAYLSTLKLNCYFFVGMMFLVFAAFVAIVGLIIGLDFITMLVIFLIIMTIQILISSTIIGWVSRVRHLGEGEIPFLEREVKALSEQAGIPMPRLGIVDDPTPNAFVYGLTQKGSTLAVHRGLMDQLNDDEIRGVLAHEIGHIKHRDAMYMTILSAVPAIAYMGMRMLLYMRFMRVGRGKGAGQVILAMLLIGLISAVIYFMSMLLVKRLSRIREFYADAYSAFATGDPHSLSSALSKITYGLSLAPPEIKSREAARAFYIGNVQNAHKEIERISRNKQKYDLDGDGVIDQKELEIAMSDESNTSAWDRFGVLLSTHPPTFKRILALKNIEKDMKKGSVIEDMIYEKVEF